LESCRICADLRLRARQTKEAVGAALILLRSAPAVQSDLEQARKGLRQAQQEFVGERSRLERARIQLRQVEEQIARKQRRLKRQKRQLKHAVRVYLLHRMPEQSVCGEIGVHEGEFARQILDVAAPRRLHLIDPWKHMEEYSRPDSSFGCERSRRRCVPQPSACGSPQTPPVWARAPHRCGPIPTEIYAGRFKARVLPWTV
jgi:hypothetical protein